MQRCVRLNENNAHGEQAICCLALVPDVQPCDQTRTLWLDDSHETQVTSIYSKYSILEILESAMSVRVPFTGCWILQYEQ